MAEPIIHDLDVLRPPSEYIHLAGKDIDVGFIPSGLSIAITNESRKLQKFGAEKLAEAEAGGEAAGESFEILAEMCSVITAAQHEEMTKDWLMQNTNLQQLSALAGYISAAVNRSMESIEDEQLKKTQAAGETNP